ncbi:orotate phosphoribosyltransferase [Psychrobacillus sp. OK028]|uniref:orotate phosphoribosyltransferase n=1 Tax=Psychrobacillus sp. OK028 TaxID=1884359 RepID=UPI0008829DD5|nr:orotate phosphoribosyltransferase [Psychrobacillus sp. OK028]SDM52797.1 orotate phosphoribosyltransferase [Psychrobacillus sp. OK028]
MSLEYKIAKALLEVGAVELKPNDQFTWASGIKSPIYCDNRITMSSPAVRKEIAQGLAEAIEQNFPLTEAVAGTATAGIPHAAWVSDVLELPMMYVRSKAKEHGRGNQIEGKVVAGQKVVVIEDLISTGGSSLVAVEALRKEGLEVLGVVSIFTYGLPKAEQAFEEAGIPFVSLTNYNALTTAAKEAGTISEADIPMLSKWHNDLKQGLLK